MTQTAPTSIRVQREQWITTSGIAEDIGITPEIYVEESYMLALMGARTVVTNRRYQKPRTNILVGKMGSEFEIVDDLDAIFTAAGNEPETTDEQTLSIPDPSADTELVDVPVQPFLLEEAEKASQHLGVESPMLAQVGFNLRLFVWLAQRDGNIVLLDTSNPMQWVQLPGTITD